MAIRWTLVVAALAAVVSSSTITLLPPLPPSVQVRTGATVEDLDEASSSLLGLSTSPSSPFETSIFNKPRALVTIEVTDVEQPASISGQRLQLDATYKTGVASRLQAKIAQQFDAADYVAVWVNGANAGGNEELIGKMKNVKIDESKLKTKDAEDLSSALRLAKAIQQSAEKLGKTQGPSVFHVTLSGNAASADVAYVVQQLSSAVRGAYGEESVVVEVAQWEKEHQRRKRETSNQPPIVGARKGYNVAVFSGRDYPAIFAIFAGLIILLVLALLYITVGLWNMDPGKDSIIYRMTTTRMKKD